MTAAARGAAGYRYRRDRWVRSKRSAMTPAQREADEAAEALRRERTDSQQPHKAARR